MNSSFGLVLVATIAAIAASPGIGEEPRREMNVWQGPESVFAERPGQIFPELVDAIATEQNGRIGNELVFWGFRQSGGRDVYLVACSVIANTECAARERRVCESGTEVISRRSLQGLVREVNCQGISLVAPGDTRPGCTDREKSQPLAVSLVACI